MTPGFAARRRAEEFNSLVEGISTVEALPTRQTDLLELVETLRETPQVEPRAEFVADLRRQLMTEAATVLTPTAARLTVTPRRNPRERRVAIAVGAFAVVSATTSMAMAAQTALPGDTLYPLKRALENASTTIQMDEDSKGASLLAHAADRLAEVNELTRESDDPNDQAVADTLHAFADQATSASDLIIASYNEEGQQSDIEELRTFAAQSMASLDHLEAVVPDAARAALIEAAQVINAIDSAAIRLCPSCAGGAAEMPTLAPASVDDLLSDLGSALAGPSGTDPRKASEGAPADGSTQGGGKAQGQDDTEDPTELPEVTPEEPTGDGRGDDGTGSGTGSNGDDDVIDALTDKLTGGNSDGPRPHRGNLVEQLDETVDGLLGGLLGN